LTILEVIGRVDKLLPNTYEQHEKIGWLSTCEWDIKRNIVDNHEGSETVAFTGYDENTPHETVLIAPVPYDELYVSWLEAQIHYANGDIGKYNNAISIYNEAVIAFRNYYNQIHKPLQKNNIKYF
jgi:hypothetical protein